MYEERVNQSVMVAMALVAATTVHKFNPAVTDFIQSPFVVFMVITLYLYNRNKNVLVSMATAFFCTVLIGILTMPEPLVKVRETFELIYPGTNSHASCANIQIKDLLSAFDGDVIELKKAMDRSSVPYNLQLTDADAPVIATYLINAGIKVGETCKLV